MILAVGSKTRSIISARISDLAVRKDVKKLAMCGSVVFISGFGLWNIDNALCGSLTQTKRALGMPWSFVFELHGWWHIFTGVGAYICWFLFLTRCSVSFFGLRCIDANLLQTLLLLSIWPRMMLASRSAVGLPGPWVWLWQRQLSGDLIVTGVLSRRKRWTVRNLNATSASKWSDIQGKQSISIPR